MKSRNYLLLFALYLAVALVCAGYPLYVIRPFRYQGPRELSFALALIQYRSWVLLLCVAGSLAGLALYWRKQVSPRLRVLAVVCVALTCIAAGLSRVNIYERMFHPVGHPEFIAIAESKLDGDEKVIAVNGRAYPVRNISYHHVVNDVVGGLPIVATY